MYEAQISFAIFTFFGIWRPQNWSSFISVWIYNLFTILMILIVYSLDISLLIYLIFYSVNDMDEFTESSFWFLAIFVVCVKIATILIRRDNIINLTKMLHKDCFQPRNNTELLIQESFDYIGRRNTIAFFSLGLCISISVALGSISQGIKGENITLPFKAWLPGHYDHNYSFWITYVIQSVGLLASTNINIATETYITVIMLQACSQLRIINHRLENLPRLYNDNYNDADINNNKNNTKVNSLSTSDEESKILNECIRHHNYMYLLCTELNEIFNFVLLVQFGGTIVDICTNIYKVSTMTIGMDQTLLQLSTLPAILVQIFLYCWYGNELMLNSLKVADAAYMIDWTVLTNTTKKGLLLLMARARKPIIITGRSIITLTLDTFVNILRTSYMAFNLLKSTTS